MGRKSSGTLPDSFPSDLFLLPKVVVFDIDGTLWNGDVECCWGPPFSSASPNSDGTVTGWKDKSGFGLDLFSDVPSILEWLSNLPSKSLCVPKKTDNKLTAVKNKKCDFSFWHLKMDSTISFEDEEEVEKRTDELNCQLSSILDIDLFEYIQNQRPIRIAYASRTVEPKWATQCLKICKLKNGQNLIDISSNNQIYPGDKTRHLKLVASAFGVDLHDILFFDNEYRNISSAIQIKVPSYYCADGLDWQEFISGLYQYQTARYEIFWREKKEQKEDSQEEIRRADLLPDRNSRTKKNGFMKCPDELLEAAKIFDELKRDN